MKYIGTITDGLLILPPPTAEARRSYLAKQKDGTIVSEELSAVREPKTVKQVKTIFGLMINTTIIQANDLGIDVSDFLKYLVDDKIPKGQGLTVDFLHEIMYAICPTNDNDERRVTLTKMNIEQASNLFERFRNIVAPLGISIDDPDPNWKDKKNGRT